ncbi:hypothetical protein SAMN02799624_05043 [Paenibacillus sp. UNC496MF]|uniref:hypothetical protein n=1 Tax=Paenibacillus sp. UNC496MF TaxID=1502753 RepID=UPI0008F0FD87|nr:hypothetical protein [Paenibacillus sp. UNC496MF]SFJ56246.1 hypothetical protein SAMN02799624_05043 [Paenibacillus sp. UNC496MF]
MGLKKNRSLIIGIIVVVVIIIGMTLRLNAENIDTTFKAEVINKIGGEDITKLELTSSINEELVRLANSDNKSEIDSLLNELSTLKLKKIKNFSQAITPETEDYSLLISINGVDTYYVNLYKNNELSIIDFTNNKAVNRYKIENEFDLEKIKKYWNAK